MEPERKIEKMLRAYAKKRRADAGAAFKLPPVTRRRLQGAVTRRAAEAEADESISLWELFRRQWAVLAGFALIMFIGASLVLPALSKAKSKSNSALVMSQLEAIGAAAQLAAINNEGRLPATLAALTNALAADLALTDPMSGQPYIYVAAGEKLETLQSNSVLAYSPEDKQRRAVLLADGRVKIMKAGEFDVLVRRGLIQHTPAVDLALRQMEVASTSQLAESAAAPTEAIAGRAAAPVAASNDHGLAKAEQRQRFKAGTTKSPLLLASFEVQQNGNAIAVVDRDGSVYNGFIETEPSAPMTVVPTTATGAVVNSQAAAQKVFFRVSGQNRTLQQKVVFTGNLLPLANADAKTNPLPPPALLFNSGIVGTVTLDVTNQVEINAVPVAP